MHNRIDITGERYGKLVALYPTDKRSNVGSVIWNFKCDCGNEKEYPMNLVRGGIKSCGCVSKKHGMTKTRLYHIWSGMRKRCKDPNNELYRGRGIYVCDEWEDFETFRKWAIDTGYDESLSIDRIDNNKGYYPDNCRWATPTQQANNTRRNVHIEIDGETHTLSEWCRIVTIVDKSTVYRRIRVHGWDPKTALYTPPLRLGERIGNV